ncbi:hypothetical protein [Lacrimispora indolis]|uniref:hypothetical protein n=1 Tax=Lacrimispora indolis TaxID=69825 RepID=UPI0004093C11|nr:hypothetical protein [[Clostridium] methoxybenzovorans]
MKKKGLIIPALVISLSLLTTPIFAASSRWEATGNTWKVKTEDGTGYLTNTWFQDNDGGWYVLGEDGAMLTGLYTDSIGSEYLLGPDGKMITEDGIYDYKGKQAYLTFYGIDNKHYGLIDTRITTNENGENEYDFGIYGDLGIEIFDVLASEWKDHSIPTEQALRETMDATYGNYIYKDTLTQYILAMPRN